MGVLELGGRGLTAVEVDHERRASLVGGVCSDKVTGAAGDGELGCSAGISLVLDVRVRAVAGGVVSRGGHDGVVSLLFDGKAVIIVHGRDGSDWGR